MTERNQKLLRYCCAFLKNLVTQTNHYFIAGCYVPVFNCSPVQTSINVSVDDSKILMTTAQN